MTPLRMNEDPFYLTFPHRLTPLSEEWLPGLLLRCDAANHWASRTTLAYLLHPGPEKFHRCWRTATPNLSVILPYSLNLTYLAQALDMPVEVLLATTYQTELTRLYGDVRLSTRHLSRSFAFHLCPACLAEHRLLRRTLTLPLLTVCPQHHIRLLTTCQCRLPLRLFQQGAPPFACSTCGVDWADLPRNEAASDRVLLEQRLLAWYEVLFSKGTPHLMLHASQLAARLMRKKMKPDRLEGAPGEWVPALVPPDFWKLLPVDDLMALLVKGSGSFHDLVA